MAKTQALNVDMTGKVALVTGATGGIGKEVARGLVRMGATVVIGARSIERGEATRAELSTEKGAAAISVLRVDVSEPSSIREAAQAFRAAHAKLDVLVNNAGVWMTERKTNSEGRELTFATNVLGPHLLTSSLMEPLRAAKGARIVNVVSSLASDYDATDLELERRKFDGFKVYAQSKQALRMLTWGQAARLEKDGIVVNAAAPGFVRTDFNANARGFTATMINVMQRLFAVSPAEGADTPLWVAVDPGLARVTGEYFDARTKKDGKFRDAAAIADLERRLDAMAGEGSAAGARAPKKAAAGSSTGLSS
jgi:NAD(P)-dependent dehydrogenase (short-subunit alcohol dehydrogenase family)